MLPKVAPFYHAADTNHQRIDPEHPGTPWHYTPWFPTATTTLLTDSSATTDHIRAALDSVLARAGKLGFAMKRSLKTSSPMVKILDLSEHMGLRTASRLEGISRIHPGYIGLRARYFVVTFALGSHFRRRRRANDCFAFFGIRDAAAAKRFLRKAIEASGNAMPRVMTWKRVRHIQPRWKRRKPRAAFPVASLYASASISTT
jgi:hypothetical protein